MSSDRNLLFGILAVQLNFVDGDSLLKAMHAWISQKERPLGDILHEHGRLAAARRQLLDALVEEHLKTHGQDVQRSLAALPTAPALQRSLAALVDADVNASLVHVGAADPRHADATTTVEWTRAAGTRFRVLRPHARGGLGEVFVAEDTELHREVALKEMQPRHAHDPVSRGRFLLEAEITARLEHPSIVPVYGLGAYDDGRPFYAMRFILGDSLKEALERFHRRSDGDDSARNLAFRQILRRFVDVCNAIAYAHSRGVLHRDLKPSNIMLGKYGETLVVDWGLAKATGMRADAEALPSQEERTLVPSSGSSVVETQAGTTIGTPAYMSPEQAAGRLDELGPAADIYSLGATLYALLTGKPPFHGADTPEILRRVQAGDFAPPRRVQPDIAAPLEAICLKAMARRPDERYRGALELAEDIEHWLADEPVSVYREPWSERTRRWARKHRTGVVGLGVLLVSTIIALAVGLYFVDDERKRTSAAEQKTQKALERALDAEQETHKALDRVTAEQRETEKARKQAVALRDQSMKSFQSMAAIASQISFEGMTTKEIVEMLLKKCQSETTTLLKSLDADPDLEARAGLHAVLGGIAAQMKDADTAVAEFDRGVTLATNVVKADPTTKNRLTMVRHHNTAATALVKLGRTMYAERHIEKAAHFLDLSAQDDSVDRLTSLTIFASFNSIATTYRTLGKPDKTLATLQKALALHQRDPHRTADPSALNLRMGIARSLIELGQDQDIEKIYLEAHDMAEQTYAKVKVGNNINRVALGNQLLNAYTMLRGESRRQGNDEHWLLWHDKSTRLLAELIEASPTNNSIHISRAVWMRAAADFEAKRNRLPEALAHMEKCVALMADLDKQGRLRGAPRYEEQYRQFKAELAAMRVADKAFADLDFVFQQPEEQWSVLLLWRFEAHVRQGRSDDYLTTAAALGKLKDGKQLFEAATSCALAARRVSLQNDLPSDFKKKTSEALLDRAMMLLTQAVDAGYANVSSLRGDLNLLPLHRRPEFQKLTAQVKTPLP